MSSVSDTDQLSDSGVKTDDSGSSTDVDTGIVANPGSLENIILLSLAETLHIFLC